MISKIEGIKAFFSYAHRHEHMLLTLLYRRINFLRNKGLSVDQISKILNIPKTKVETYLSSLKEFKCYRNNYLK